MNFILEAYKNIESPKNFSSDKELMNYRELLLKRAKKKEIPLLKKLILKKSNILEIGSGNSRLLYSLNGAGLLKEGVGVEISPSRYKFAEEWRKDLKIKNVKNICKDILSWKNYRKYKGYFDTVLCLTGIFPFFAVLEKEGDKKALDLIRFVLKDKGQAIIEIDTFNKEIDLCKTNNNRVRLWGEYYKDDPFRFELIKFNWNPRNNILTAKTYNLKRNELFVDGPTTKIFKIYNKKELHRLLTKFRFSNIKLYSNYDYEKPFWNNQTKNLIIQARV